MCISLEATLHLQPFADDPGALLTISRPCFAEAASGQVDILNAERILDDLRGLVTLFTVDRLLKDIGHRYASRL
jgi:hypothetical protein